MDAQNPSALSLTLSRQALIALRDAANALAAVASAALGEASCPDPKILPSTTTIYGAASGETTVLELVREFLNAKARAGRSDRYLRALRVSLKSFSQGRARTPLEAVTFKEIEAWLDGNNWAARTKHGYLSDVRVMFNFAVRRGLVRHNPAAAVELPVVESDAVGIHTPGQVHEALEFAREFNPTVCRALAVRYFSGLRSAEIERLEEKEIGEKFIEVTAAKSKTRRRRLVTIQPNLRAWLDLGGVLPLRNQGNHMAWFVAALAKQKQIEWPHNVTRHSFVSYHLAAFQNAGKTALEAGHTEQMLFAHYREIVTPEAALQFWNLKPV